MAFVCLPNFFFEEELSNAALSTSKTSKRLAAELAPVIAFLTNGDDDVTVIVESDSIPQGLPASLSRTRFLKGNQIRRTSDADQNDPSTFLPWGCSPRALKVGRQAGFDPMMPAADCVRFVNSREFLDQWDVAVACEQTSHQPQAERRISVLCRTLNDVIAALERFDADGFPDWVIKANVSHAARNRILGKGQPFSASHENWLRSQLSENGCVCVEPWVDRIAECGLQFTIPSDSSAEPIRFDGAAEMLTDSNGQYCGSWVRPAETIGWWCDAIPNCKLLASKARQSGYFGPIGFDCMKFRDPQSGVSWLRFCHDVNARFTMGRIALSLRNFLTTDETAVWLHAAADRWNSAGITENSQPGNLIEFRNSCLENVRIVPTSPAAIGAQPTQLKTALLISTQENDLQNALHQILWQTSAIESDR